MLSSTSVSMVAFMMVSRAVKVATVADIAAASVVCSSKETELKPLFSNSMVVEELMRKSSGEEELWSNSQVF